MLLENLTGGSFIWTRPSKTKLPLAVDTPMKYSRGELSSVKGCTNCDASAQVFFSKCRSKSSKFKLIRVFKPHKSNLNKQPSATSNDRHEWLPILPLFMKITKRCLNFSEQILILQLQEVGLPGFEFSTKLQLNRLNLSNTNISALEKIKSHGDFCHQSKPIKNAEEKDGRQLQHIQLLPLMVYTS